MGSKLGPNYACFFVGYVEEAIPSQYHGFVPQLHKSTPMTSSESHVVAAWNWKTIFTSYPTFILLFNLRTDTELYFLAITLRITDDHISTTIYYKDTDTHTSLHHQSSHSSHCKKGLPRSQLSRLRRLCSEDSRFPGKGRWNGVFLWTTWILPRLVAERSPGHLTVRPDWCAKKSQPL